MGGESDQGPVIALLSRPGTYAGKPASVRRIDTHGAMIFLAGEEAWKIKRAVHFSYMDFSTAEKRRRALSREFEINQPHAPGLYLGVVPVTREADGTLRLGGEGEPVEWALRMRRFPDEALFSTMAERAPLEASLCKALADAAFAFHAAALPRPGADSAGQMRAIAGEVSEALLPMAPELPAAMTGAFQREALAAIERGAGLLAKRAEAGLVRRCHGDLHLANIVLWGGKPVLFDALEFDEEMATVDTLYDLAFLLMDLEHRGQRAGANAVLNRYLWRSQSVLDLEGLSLLPLFLALRAGVRAMVTGQRALQRQGEERASGFSSATRYLETALASLAPHAARLVAVGGLSGTGKSTLAAALAPMLGCVPGAVHLRSDLERKALFGVGETERLPVRAYGPETGARVYDVLLQKAEAALKAGHAVVTDAVYARAEERAAIEDVARRAAVPFTGLWLEAPAPVLKSRVEARRGDASDATADVVARQLDYDLGAIRWARVAAGGAASETLAAAVALIPEITPRP